VQHFGKGKCNKQKTKNLQFLSNHFIRLIDQNKSTSEKEEPVNNIPVRGARRCLWAGNSVDFD
jgi:hypothetical protein